MSTLVLSAGVESASLASSWSHRTAQASGTCFGRRCVHWALTAWLFVAGENPSVRQYEHC